MFLDIDEFWTPADFSTTVGVYLSEFCRMRAKGAICHLWHNELGGGKPFQPIGPKIEWKIARNVKTLFPVDAKLEQINVHCPAFANDVPVYNADGEVMRFEPGTRRERGGSERFREAFVLHRMFRSEIEYMASLRRGRPKKNEALLKDNRSGYIEQRGLEAFKISPEIHSMYIERRSEFYTKTGIKDLVEQEKRKVISRGNLAKESIVQALNGNYGAKMNEIAKRVARGLQSIADIS